MFTIFPSFFPSANYGEINQLQVFLIPVLTANVLPPHSRERMIAKDHHPQQRQQWHMPKKGIFEESEIHSPAFSPYPISNQSPIFQHSSRLAAAPSGPLFGWRKTGRQSVACSADASPFSCWRECLSSMFQAASRGPPLKKHPDTWSRGWGPLSLFSGRIKTFFFSLE